MFPAILVRREQGCGMHVVIFFALFLSIHKHIVFYIKQTYVSKLPTKLKVANFD